MELYNSFFTDVLKQDPPTTFPTIVNAKPENFHYASTSESDGEGELKASSLCETFEREVPHEGVEVFTNEKSDQFVCYLESLWHIRLAHNQFTQYAVNWSRKEPEDEVLETFQMKSDLLHMQQRYQNEQGIITRIVDQKNQVVMFQVASCDWKQMLVWYSGVKNQNKGYIIISGEAAEERLSAMFYNYIQAYLEEGSMILMSKLGNSCSYINQSPGYLSMSHFVNGQLQFCKVEVHSLQDPSRRIFQQISLPVVVPSPRGYCDEELFPFGYSTFPLVRTRNWTDDEKNELYSDEEG